MAGSASSPAEAQATKALLERRSKVLSATYRHFYRSPVTLVRGSDVWLYDADGRAYLDVYNNVACIGHSHPAVVGAIARQAAILNTHTRYLHEAILDYSDRLLATMPADIENLVFTCTGSEANDLAYRIATAVTGNAGVIVTENAYHGGTAAVASFSPSLGGPLAPFVRAIAPPSSAAADGGARFTQDVEEAVADLSSAGLAPAMLIVDTIFSSDGILADPPGFLKPAVDLVRRAGGLFVADEVQPGFGRIGPAFWGFARHDCLPDLVTMGKPMGNGHPVAALAGRRELLDAFGRKVRYFNTFGGNPVSIAAANQVLDVIEQSDLATKAETVGEYLIERLNQVASRCPQLGPVRGAGLFLGIDVVDSRGKPDGPGAALIIEQLRDRAVLIGSAGNAGHVLKIRPPLTFKREHAALLVETLASVLAVGAGGTSAQLTP
ncbi:MAG: aspartate aminotransferase family protein [Pseudorhodoplanes sp.]|nr:aspartate aminotransferase family protein [Pseudorhodoplanes sp.]